MLNFKRFYCFFLKCTKGRVNSFVLWTGTINTYNYVNLNKNNSSRLVFSCFVFFFFFLIFLFSISNKIRYFCDLFTNLFITYLGISTTLRHFLRIFIMYPRGHGFILFFRDEYKMIDGETSIIPIKNINDRKMTITTKRIGAILSYF